MWRIYTNQETLETLSKKYDVHTICGFDMEVYVCDPVFSDIISYLAVDGILSDFSAEYVPDSVYNDMCESAGLIP